MVDLVFAVDLKFETGEFEGKKQKNRHREGDGFRRFPTCIIMDFAGIVKWGAGSKPPLCFAPWLPCVRGAGTAHAVTEGLTVDDNPSVNASRHLPLHKGGFEYAPLTITAKWV